LKNIATSCNFLHFLSSPASSTPGRAGNLLVIPSRILTSARRLERGGGQGSGEGVLVRRRSRKDRPSSSSSSSSSLETDFRRDRNPSAGGRKAVEDPGRFIHFWPEDRSPRTLPAAPGGSLQRSSTFLQQLSSSRQDWFSQLLKVVIAQQRRSIRRLYSRLSSSQR